MSVYEFNEWVMAFALILYVLLGGADFGAGVWDLLATGSPEEKRQMRLRIGEAISPIWEANHVWLILLVVVLFTCFPPAFAAITTALHIPITIALLGIVMRGASFAFRKYTPPGRRKTRRRWGIAFSIASVVTPLCLGVIAGTAVAGQLRWDENGVYQSGFFEPWLNWFPWCVGVMTLTIFIYLAAVYLCVELVLESDGRPRSQSMLNSLRFRAICSAVAVAIAATAAWLVGRQEAETFMGKLSGSRWSFPLLTATALAGGAAVAALIGRRFILARACAVAQVILLILGYARATHPHVIVPQFTFDNTAAPYRTQQLVAWAVAGGAVLLFPSLWYLFRVFKGRHVFDVLERE